MLVGLANSVRSTLQYNFQGQSHFLMTAFNIESWNYYRTDYSDSIINKFLQFGWPINYTFKSASAINNL